jgi:TolA-binding protein
MDFPGAEIIADRLASINPLAQIDDQSKIPPQVQMQIKQMQDALQQMGQQNQQLQMYIKQRQDVEEVKQGHEDRRAMLNAQVKVNDQNTRSVTSQNKMEIDALMELILHHMDTAKLEREISARNQEQYGFANQATASLQPSNVAQSQ